MKRKPTYTPLGLWYIRLPRVMRKKFLADTYERGLSPGRVRAWMYFNIVPTMENMKIVEELTGIKYEQLFPY
jgi:hypothetical protein